MTVIAACNNKVIHVTQHPSTTRGWCITLEQIQNLLMSQVSPVLTVLHCTLGASADYCINQVTWPGDHVGGGTGDRLQCCCTRFT